MHTCRACGYHVSAVARNVPIPIMWKLHISACLFFCTCMYLISGAWLLFLNFESVSRCIAELPPLDRTNYVFPVELHVLFDVRSDDVARAVQMKWVDGIFLCAAVSRCLHMLS